MESPIPVFTEVLNVKRISISDIYSIIRLLSLRNSKNIIAGQPRNFLPSDSRVIAIDVDLTFPTIIVNRSNLCECVDDREDTNSAHRVFLSVSALIPAVLFLIIQPPHLPPNRYTHF